MKAPGFEAALERTLEWEGVYSRDDRDPGGETVFGVARKRWGGWVGWAIVDELAKVRGDGLALVERLRKSEALRREVELFYRASFWLPLGCEDLAAVAPDLAGKLFAAGVNLGSDRALELLQAVLAGYGREVAVDGVFGPVTLAAARSVCSDPGGAEGLLAGLRAACRAYYAGLMRGNPRLEVYRRGWFRRAAA
ncbi:MAG: hypothetical protein IPQ07_40015 [Myxococcales bacterium]|nr:hypothetical protein [Myxococcales bacterium]